MGLLRKMAWPISMVYGVVVHCRNLLYDHQVLKSKNYKTPTVCVGNLSVGGTGKTPMIEFLISKLQKKYKLAVLSRGYKRNSKGFQLGTLHSTVEQLGDEPFQIQRKFPRIQVAVDADRQNGISVLQKLVGPDLILLDDAFQHRRVAPTFSILLTTYSNPFFKDRYLPTGDLRDTKRASRRADCIVVTKCPKNMEKSKEAFYTKRLKKSSDQIVLFSTLTYDDRLYGNPSLLKLNDLKEKHFTLVTGIANPSPLIHHLTENDLDFAYQKFPDHHQFSPSEIETLKKEPLLLTTEKDYGRFHDKIQNLYYIKVEHQFLEDGERELLRAIDTKIKPYSQRWS
ncbi:MAG: tetraacyldisaccharide 4'-kinase [Bacteroidota bacterium]